MLAFDEQLVRSLRHAIQNKTSPAIGRCESSETYEEHDGSMDGLSRRFERYGSRPVPKLGPFEKPCL